MKRLTDLWIRIAVVYFGVGVLMGAAMGATHNFTLRPVHVHVNLLGWVSMFLIGLLHQYLADSLNLRLARVQFWIYQTAVPVMLLALTGLMLGHAAFEPVLGVASIAVCVSVLMLVFNVFWRSGLKTVEDGATGTACATL